jgi:phosphoesterase RecJ-like protein
VLVTTHQKPDGDAIGSVLAVLRACRAIGVRAEGWMVGPCEGNLRLFQGDDAVGIVDPRNPAMPDGEFDLAVVVDTGAWTQLEILAPWLRAMSERVIGLDHHARGDEVASRRIVDVSCGSCTALLIRLVDALGVDPAFGADPRGRYSIAEALYLGLATDTGWFRFPNARAAEFALASRLLAAGVDKDAMYQQIEQSSRAGRVLIQGRALSEPRASIATEITMKPLASSSAYSACHSDRSIRQPHQLAQVVSTTLRPRWSLRLCILPLRSGRVKSIVQSAIATLL